MAMKPGMMMIMQRMAEPRQQSEYGGGNRRMIGYDRDGPNMRGGYDRPTGGTPTYGGYDGGMNNRYEMNGGYEGNYGGGYESPENRRRRSSRTGRYIRGMGGMDDDDGEYERRGYSPQARGGNSYGDIYAEGTIYAPGAMNRTRGGMDKHHQPHEIDEETAMEWVAGMKNADGTKGPHYKIDQVEQWRATNCMDCDKWEFFAAVNMMYSDYCKTAEKMGVSKLDFYGHMAKDFLKDEDAVPDKLYKYKEYIAEK